MGPMRRVVPFTELGRGDVGRVGGKNASLGELYRLHDGVSRRRRGGHPLDDHGRALPEPLKTEIIAAYEALGQALGRSEPEIAVRNSATAEDLPEVSFADRQETRPHPDPPAAGPGPGASRGPVRTASQRRPGIRRLPRPGRHRLDLRCP
ncbi:PEP/pyruvate-binding domain-containing protein [Streptomyces sp. NPDC051364]|uniref:PEP/pyruvate-binding domain-containing protein n=1 Tax=Streptomyces sp. NPDC051364 TaxID=3155799 RepID=UPI003429CEC2